MLAKKAIYENGRLTFVDHTRPVGRATVIVTFLQDDPPADEQVTNRQAFLNKWAGVIAHTASDIDDLRQQRRDQLRAKHA